nr:PREDICTED: UDP-glucuronosyltransferase 2B2-like isoform X1 [Bemisia tabaci]XP_018899272.1 PREDICTED: UDP-glucuronosyltransferase 2B2-like isoform X1 [Bemisia tabaci]
MRWVLLALTASCLAIGCPAHDILVFLPLPIWSHYVQVEPIFHALAERGHNVTVCSPYPPKKRTENFNHILLGMEKWTDLMASWNPVDQFKRWHPVQMVPEWKALGDLLVPEILGSDILRGLLGSKFDLIFMELFFGQEAFVVLGRLFNASIVSYSSFGYSPQVLRAVGATNAFSYVPHKDLPYAGPMSLLQRLNNAFLSYATMLHFHYWYYPAHDEIITRLVPGRHPPIVDMLGNVSLVFLTGNTALDGARLYPPCVVQLTALHLKDPKPLDKELKSIMDKAEHGVIYFSYGSIIKMSHLPRSIIEMFLSTFERLDQTVLWKTDLNTTDLNIPKNVHVRSWFEQTSILAHSNCVLFVTHGGLSSMMEAIRAAVPIVGTSFYGDQIINLANAEYYGFGIHVHYSSLTQQSFHAAITRVLSDPTFKLNVIQRSNIFKDEPVPPLDEAVYWVEYVIRHKGAHHLKPLAAYIPWYQLFLFDVIVVFSAAFLVLAYTVYIVVKVVLYLTRSLCGGSKSIKVKLN